MGDPVISVDTKKKELVGLYANGGTEWEPAGEPRRVNVHDFPDSDLGKAVPYGVYDVGANTGWVNVGTDADTAQFAVESIRRWWNTVGKLAYPDARRLLINADSGGSNGSRQRLWKTELAGFATETGLEITVLHLPPGTSKWNRIEHRLFSHISMNWRGRPLTSHEVIVETIAATATKTGLRVRAVLDTDSYPKGIKISDKEMKAFEAAHPARHDFHGDWNYTVAPDTSHDRHARTLAIKYCASPYPGRFHPTAAWLVCAMIAFNLTRAAGCLASAFHAKATTATIWTQLITIPARLAPPPPPTDAAPALRLAVGAPLDLDVHRRGPRLPATP